MFHDPITKQPLTFLDCVGGRDVINDDGSPGYAFYSPITYPKGYMEDLIRSLPEFTPESWQCQTPKSP